MDDDRLTFRPWEIAAWLTVVAVGLIVLHAVFQYRVERANESHFTPRPPATRTVCVPHGACHTYTPTR